MTRQELQLILLIIASDIQVLDEELANDQLSFSEYCIQVNRLIASLDALKMNA